jgi:signal transduction histidine kinase
VWEFIKNREFEAGQEKNFESKMSELEGELILEDQGPKCFIFNIKVGSVFWKNEEATIVDITDISHIKEYQEAMEIHKLQILGAFSHNIKTPLNGILGMTELSLCWRQRNLQSERS